jgi:ribosomal protein S28E/S33
MAPPYRYTSHEGLSHGALESLGHDWEKVATPTLAPRYPFKVYLPRSTEDIVAAVREARRLGQRVVVRGSGHSSNDLVVREHGVLLSTAYLTGLVSVDAQALTATLQAGAITAEVDERLGRVGLGLPVMGDHNDITAGGFASAGGIGPASHRVGTFIDNVVALDYVDWEGEVHRLRRETDAAEMLRVLGGTGQHGVLATLTLRLVRIDKEATLLRHRRQRPGRVEDFLAQSAREMVDPANVLQRCLWMDTALLGRQRTFGRVYAYGPARRTPWALLRSRVAWRYLYTLGEWAGRLPKLLDTAVKALGFLGMKASPRYGTFRQVERFTDRILDYSVGDPSRFFIALVPMASYPALFQAWYRLARDYRERHGCFTALGLYTKGIQSPWLNGGDGRFYCELTLYTGFSRQGLSPELLERFVSELDEQCLASGAFRYMHTRTVKDSERRRRLDPNTRYAARAPAQPAPEPQPEAP